MNYIKLVAILFFMLLNSSGLLAQAQEFFKNNSEARSYTEKLPDGFYRTTIRPSINLRVLGIGSTSGLSKSSSASSSSVQDTSTASLDESLALEKYRVIENGTFQYRYPGGVKVGRKDDISYIEHAAYWEYDYDDSGVVTDSTLVEASIDTVQSTWEDVFRLAYGYNISQIGDGGSREIEISDIYLYFNLTYDGSVGDNTVQFGTGDFIYTWAYADLWAEFDNHSLLATSDTSFLSFDSTDNASAYNNLSSKIITQRSHPYRPDMITISMKASNETADGKTVEISGGDEMTVTWRYAPALVKYINEYLPWSGTAVNAGGTLSLYNVTKSSSVNDSIISGTDIETDWESLYKVATASAELSYSGESLKFHHWGNAANFANLNTQIEYQDSLITENKYHFGKALFRELYPVTINSGSSDPIQLRDPWYIDGQGNQPNTFRQVSGSISVFPGQEERFTSNKTHYSVKATESLTVTSTDIITFGHWSATPVSGATFGDANALETWVVFDSVGVVVTAVYNSANANGRPIYVEYGDSLVLADGGQYILNSTLDVDGIIKANNATITSDSAVVIDLSGWASINLQNTRINNFDLEIFRDYEYTGTYGNEIIFTNTIFEDINIDIEADGVGDVPIQSLAVFEHCTLLNSSISIIDSTLGSADPAWQILLNNSILDLDSRLAGGVGGVPPVFNESAVSDNYSIIAYYPVFQGFQPSSTTLLAIDPMLNADGSLQYGSPAIDAGDPSYAYDPDGSVTDMGAVYFPTPPEDITLSGQSITDTISHEALNSITVDTAFTIESGGDLTLAAGTSVRFLPGFHAKVGSHMVATVGYVPPQQTPPGAPTNLQIAGSYGDNPILTWDANTEPDLKQYKVYRYLSGLSPNLITTTTNTIYYDDDVVIKDIEDLVYYYVKAEDDDGNISGPSNTVEINADLVKGIVDTALPKEFGLSQNYPNPFNPSTTLSYDLASQAKMSLVVYDITGRKVAGWRTHKEAGSYHQVWSGTDARGRPLPSGIYLYRLVATPTDGSKPFVQTRKMLLLK